MVQKIAKIASWEYNGVPCLVLYNTRLGVYLGYVGVPPSHPLAGVDKDEIDVDVHGGVTFADWGDDDEIRPRGWYWIGFDCGHYGDESWDVDDVKAEVEHLANQVAALSR